jgi:malonate decarboxylase epsilon subunit
MRTAFLFPGQGAQAPNFLHALPEHEAVRVTFAEAAQVLDLDPAEMDSEDALRSTVAVQLGTLIAGVAYNRLLAAEEVHPDAVAGLSVGAFAAAVASGALAFADALRLVRLRSEAMEQAYGHGGYGMSAILGLREADIQTLIDGIANPTMPLYLASVNAPAELVLAGNEAALSAAAHAAHRAGARARQLSVSVPSHCPLLDGVSARLRAAMRGIGIDRARVPYISNHRARALYDGEDIAEDLILNVSHTVRWRESVTLLYELGCRLFIEAPPGRALSNLVKSEFPEARAVAAADVEFVSVVHLARLASLP